MNQSIRFAVDGRNQTTAAITKSSCNPDNWCHYSTSGENWTVKFTILSTQIHLSTEFIILIDTNNVLHFDRSAVVFCQVWVILYVFCGNNQSLYSKFGLLFSLFIGSEMKNQLSFRGLCRNLEKFYRTLSLHASSPNNAVPFLNARTECCNSKFCFSKISRNFKNVAK